MALTEDADKVIREAIRIVREDRFEKFVRDNHTRPVTPKQDDELITEDEEEKDPKSKATPPPQKETKETEETLPRKRDAWWGEIES